MINVFYLSGNTTGGWVTFTYHLMTMLGATENVRLWRIGNRTESKPRPFGYRLDYTNITLEDALALDDGPKLLAAVAKNFAGPAEALISQGAKVVLHDPTELRAGLAGVNIERPWVIRKAVQRQVPGSVFIRHPYARRATPAKPPKRKGAISTSRIDFDKHTDLILDANRLGAGVRIYGFENRLYTKFKIMPNYPEWEQSKAAYPRTPDAAFELLMGAEVMVDMSIIKGDGGGTQYTFLEAWDAGAVPVLHSNWILPNDDMKVGVNCLAANDPKALVVAIKAAKRDRVGLITAGQKQLSQHGKPVYNKIMEWLNA